MDTARLLWQILQRVPDELANMVREFMVIGDRGEGVLLITENGNGYWLGEMKFREESKQALEPTRLDVPKLTSMAHGEKHILLLDEEGHIHAMGKNNWGQLGLGTVNQESHFSPQLISSLHRFISVRCGMRHSLALTEDGKVWAWGNNSRGQVGMPNSTADIHPFPRQITELNSYRVVSIVCGGCQSFALTDQGEVYSWGENYWGQLGYGNCVEDKFYNYTPTQIPTPSPIQSIASGDSHTLLLTQTGEVYAFGGNNCGQLGTKSVKKKNKSRVSLVKIAVLPVISQIFSHFGTDMSIAMTAERECFVWGNLGNKTLISTQHPLPPVFSTLDSVLSLRSTQRNTPHSVRIEGLVCPKKTPSTQLTESKFESKRLSDKMFDNPDTNPDVKFELGDQSILAHRSVLQISSGHFFQFFSKHSNLNPPTSISQSRQLPLRYTTNQFRPDPKITSNSPHSQISYITIPISDNSFERFFSEPFSSANINLLTPSFQSSHTTNPSESNSQISQISPLSQISLITIPIPDHSYFTFYAYIRFLYTGTLQVPAEHLVDLFKLAHSHLESDLEEVCLERMRFTVSLENCCIFYQITEQHSLPEFQQELVQFIADNNFQVFLTTAFQSMDGNLCKKLAISIANLLNVVFL